MSSTNSEFRTLLLSLRDFFAADKAAVSVNTEKFGTIHRDEVDRLLALTVRRGA